MDAIAVTMAQVSCPPHMTQNTSKHRQQTIQEKKRGKHEKTSVTKCSRCQHNTDDGGQATGEEMRHVQMSR